MLPGALTALRHFADDPRVHQGVLTANLRSVAKVKLEEFGLAHLVDWEVSAFGDDHADRAELVTFARDRARHLRPFAHDEVVLIGDTPHDVYAATKAGVGLVAVATGRSTAEELRAAGADEVMPDLNDLDELVRQVWKRASQKPHGMNPKHPTRTSRSSGARSSRGSSRRTAARGERGRRPRAAARGRSARAGGDVRDASGGERGRRSRAAPGSARGRRG